MRSESRAALTRTKMAERERESFTRNNLYNGVVSGAARRGADRRCLALCGLD